jgi:preprotein translocase subunit SecF
MLEILKNPNFDFLGKAKYFVGLSLLLIAAGVFVMLRPDGLRFGVEFSGGVQVIAKFQKTPDVDRIRAAVPDAVIQNYDAPSKNQVLVRRANIGESVEQAAPEILTALSTKYADNPVVESSAEVVGPVVGAELRKKAVQLTVLGLIFQLIYIAVRFKGAVWGAAATVAVFHDVLVTLGILAMLRFEITLNVIAALLTLVGYSVNDTIVIFDRARENLRHKRKDSLRKIINDSVNQTLSRTLISNGTTWLAVLGLMFGGEVLRGFAFTMAVGIVVGTYSTIYIASPFVIWWTDLMGKRQGPGGTVKAAM